jgi:hypothetical protein
LDWKRISDRIIFFGIKNLVEKVAWYKLKTLIYYAYLPHHLVLHVSKHDPTLEFHFVAIIIWASWPCFTVIVAPVAWDQRDISFLIYVYNIFGIDNTFYMGRNDSNSVLSNHHKDVRPFSPKAGLKNAIAIITNKTRSKQRSPIISRFIAFYPLIKRL